MTNSINDAIDAHAAHDLANELAAVGVTATRSGNRNLDDEVCEISGYGRVFFRDESWVVQAHTNDFEYLIDNDELAAELLEVVAMTKKVS